MKSFNSLIDLRELLISLEKSKVYHAFFWDPRTGLEYDLGQVSGDAQAEWFPPFTPEQKDWVLVLE